MAPTTKAGTAKPLLGQPDSVLSPEFLLAVQANRPCDDILPFARPLQAQLPSIELNIIPLSQKGMYFVC